jgi:hypothetical protein
MRYSVAFQVARLAASQRSGASSPRTCTASGDNVRSCPGEQHTPLTTTQSVGTHWCVMRMYVDLKHLYLFFRVPDHGCPGRQVRRVTVPVPQWAARTAAVTRWRVVVWLLGVCSIVDFFVSTFVFAITLGWIMILGTLERMCCAHSDQDLIKCFCLKQRRNVAGNASSQGSSVRTCSNCGLTGHNKATCRKKQTCSRCKLPGHNATTCRLQLATELRSGDSAVSRSISIEFLWINDWWDFL